MSTPVFIIAQQRSGTNLLRRSLATTGCFLDSDEIFDPKTEAYWPFHVAQVQADNQLALPTAENQIELFERFLNIHLANEKPFTLIDVKYNSTHRLDGMWHSPMMLPEFIQWLGRKKYPVIHLVRKNCLESYVSLLIGHNTGQWVAEKSAPSPELVSLQLDAAETVFQIQRREREIRRFRRSLAQTNHMELEYESLIEQQGGFSKTVAGQISDFLGLQNAVSVQVPTKKTGRSIRNTIENLDSEILPALVDHGLDKYVSPNPQPNQSTSCSPHRDQPEPRVIKVRPRPALHFVNRIQRSKPKSKPVFVIAMQRSGTNLFRQSLASSSRFHDLNEIFDPYRKIYWPFREQMIRERAEMAMPTVQNQLEIFECFLDETLHSRKPFTFIDVKYNSTQHLNDVWYHPGARPQLFEWLIEQRCPVIHLVRENVLENYVSNVVAHKSQVWLQETSTPGEEISIQLEAADTLRVIQTFQSQIDVFRKWLEPTNHIELTYESLIDASGGFSPEVVRRTCQLVGIDSELEITIPTRKTGRSLSQMVENYDSEIAPALLEHGYADWLTGKAA